MRMNNISQASKKRTIAIWCIPQQETQLHGQVHEQWKKFFIEDDSFWLEGYSDISLREQMNTLIQSSDDSYLGAQYNVALFYDFRNPVDRELLDQVKSFFDIFNSRFYGYITTTTHFGYVKDYSHDAPNNDVKQRNCEMLSQIFPMQRVFLVAEFLMKREHSSCWDPVILFLDIERRDPNFLANITKQHWVGYMKYRAFDAEKRRIHQQMIEKLEKELRNDPDVTDASINAAKIKMNTALDRRVKAVEEKYSVNGAYQPMHPDLDVSRIGGIFAPWKRMKALKPGGSYENAAKVTAEAVSATAQKLYKEIMEQFHLEKQEADSLFEDMINDMNLSSLNGGAINAAIKEYAGSQPYVEPLDLSYSKEESCSKRIETYLSEMKELAVADGKTSFCETLLAASARHKTRINYGEKLKEAKDNLLTWRKKLNTVTDLKQFCERSVLGDELEGLTAVFATLNAVKHRVCLDIGLDSEQMSYLEKNVEVPHHNATPQVSERISFLTIKDDPSLDADEAQPLRVIEIWLFDNSQINTGVF